VQHFGSVRGVKEASFESLSALVPAKMARLIFTHFHPETAAEAIVHPLIQIETS
jgi:hypothetical protein